MIKEIIFDFDGTIADSKELTYSIYNQLAEKHKLPKITRSIQNQLRGKNLMEICTAMKVPLYKLPIIGMEFANAYQNKIGTLQPFPYIEDLLQALHRKGISLSIISNNNKNNIARFIKKHKINYFDRITCGHYLNGKEVLIKKYLQARKQKKEDMIYVGDEIRDIEACRKNNLSIIAVTWGYDPDDLLRQEHPTYIAYKPQEIYTLLKAAKQLQ